MSVFINGPNLVYFAHLGLTIYTELLYTFAFVKLIELSEDL